MSDPNTAPVPLPVGSFDYDALKKGLDKAAKGADKNYAANVEAALDDANTASFKSQDARDIPGYKFVDVENKDLGVTENVQVFDAKLAEKIDDDSDGAIPEADLRNTHAENVADAVDAASGPTQE